jgi:ribosome maturation factor RimP
MVAPLIESSLKGMGYRLVRVIWQGSDKRRILQIMAEREDFIDMTVDDCADISHMVSAILDVKDPIDGAYELEVSSPGVDRPLMNAQDFADYAGHKAKVEMAIPQNGRKRFGGVIVQATPDELTLKDGGDVWELAIEEMASAKLVMTDELMKESLKRSEENLKKTTS